jgi:dihydroxyacid dehydratase/phosphogluconate dehydratase
VTGRPIIEGAENAGIYNEDVIRPLDRPIYAEGATAVLRGNLAPNGCVMKPSAAEAHFRKHQGPAIVFESYAEMKAAIDRDDLDVTPDHVMVLKNAGPLGGPGMPEWGMLPIPKKLIKAGVRDMLRISDARMSGTSYGACVLHVSPEAYIGGTLALVKNGDIISLDVARRTIELQVPEEVLATRRSAWRPPPPRYERGFGWLAARHMSQAHRGCDFDFLETGFGAAVGEPAIY